MHRKIITMALVASSVAEKALADVTPTPVMTQGFWDDVLSNYNDQVASRTTSSTTSASTRTLSSTRTSTTPSTTTSTSPPTLQSPQSTATSLNNLFDSILDAFTCGGQQNLSGTFAGLSNLIGAVGGDPYFLDAAEAALYGNFTLFQTPAFFMGIGIGEGAIVGLNATTEAEAEGYAAAAAAAVDNGGQTNGANGAGAASFNNVAREFGLGLVNISLPAILASDSEDFFAGLNLSELIRGAGVGFADGLGTALKPVLGRDIDVFGIQIDDRSVGFENDSRGAGGLAYSFTRGLASQVGNLGLAFIGVQTDGTQDMLRQEIESQDGRRAVAEPSRKAHRGTAHLRDVTGPLINPAKSDQIVSEFAQVVVSELSCSALGGIWALALDFLSGGSDSAIPRIPNFSGYDLPDIDMTVRSHENRYEVNLKSFSAKLNGVPISSFIGLLIGHIVIGMFALVGIFPTVLIIGAVDRLAIAIGTSSNSARVSRMIKTTQIAVLPVLVIAGFALGVASAGNSRHFRTPHAILGLILSILSLANSGFILFRRKPQKAQESKFTSNHKRFPSSTSSAFSPNDRRHGKRTFTSAIKPSIFELACILLLLGLTFATWITGVEDLRLLSLCVIEVISATLIAAIASIINGLLNSAAAIVVLEHWLWQRIQSPDGIHLRSQDTNKARQQSPRQNGHIGEKEIKHLVPIQGDPIRDNKRHDHVHSHYSHHTNDSVDSSIEGTRSARMVRGARVVDLGEKRREDVGVAF